MIKKKLSSVILLAALVAAGCSSFITDIDSEQASLKYESGEYVLRQDINRNNMLYPQGSIVKLIVQISDDWIKVYAYNSGEGLLASNRFLLVYMFAEDFPDEVYSREAFEAELLKVVKPAGSAEKPGKGSLKGTKKDK